MDVFVRYASEALIALQQDGVRNAHPCPNAISRACVDLCNCPTVEADSGKCPFF